MSPDPVNDLASTVSVVVVMGVSGSGNSARHIDALLKDRATEGRA